MDGSDWWSRPMDEEALAKTLARGDRIGDVHRTVERIAREKRDRIEEVFPNLNRYMTGYDLAHIRRADGRFDLNAVLCGSEGTLAMIAEAELNLLPIPAQAALVNIRYSDFNAALEDARTLSALNVASVETIDEKVLGLAKNDIVWTDIARFFPESHTGVANGINLVEVLADDEAELQRKLEAVTAVLDEGLDINRLTILWSAGMPTSRRYGICASALSACSAMWTAPSVRSPSSRIQLSRLRTWLPISVNFARYLTGRASPTGCSVMSTQGCCTYGRHST
ncbi:hypothetical protein AJ87_40800 [Rhizobium yanglingense]|nr:hypothetical protein AJ87_40800 [Rhizobium yanglingense]